MSHIHVWGGLPSIQTVLKNQLYIEVYLVLHFVKVFEGDLKWWGFMYVGPRTHSMLTVGLGSTDKGTLI